MVISRSNVVTTTQELQMIGNCLKYSRAVLSFDKSFDEEPHLQIYKELLTDAFGVPKNHPKSKPFVDHMFCFYWVDNRIWFRHYQVKKCNPALQRNQA
jgi:ribosome biogenesis protein BRX1